MELVHKSITMLVSNKNITHITHITPQGTFYNIVIFESVKRQF